MDIFRSPLLSKLNDFPWSDGSTNEVDPSRGRHAVISDTTNYERTVRAQPCNGIVSKISYRYLGGGHYMDMQIIFKKYKKKFIHSKNSLRKNSWRPQFTPNFALYEPF